MPYNKHISETPQMRLLTSATQVDFFPIGTGTKRFVKRVTWHLGGGSEMVTYSTIVKTDALYSIRNLIANGAEVIDFNTEEIPFSEYSPMMC